MWAKSFGGFCDSCLSHQPEHLLKSWGEIGCICTFYRNRGCGQMKWGHQWESTWSSEDVLSWLSFWIHYSLLGACHLILSSWMSLLILISFQVFVLYSCPSEGCCIVPFVLLIICCPILRSLFFLSLRIWGETSLSNIRWLRKWVALHRFTCSCKASALLQRTHSADKQLPVALQAWAEQVSAAVTASLAVILICGTLGQLSPVFRSFTLFVSLLEYWLSWSMALSVRTAMKAWGQVWARMWH